MRDVAAEVERLAWSRGWWLIHRKASKTSASVYLFFAKPKGGEWCVRLSDHPCTRRVDCTGVSMFSISSSRLRPSKRERFLRWMSRRPVTATP